VPFHGLGAIGKIALAMMLLDFGSRPPNQPVRSEPPRWSKNKSQKGGKFSSPNIGLPTTAALGISTTLRPQITTQKPPHFRPPPSKNAHKSRKNTPRPPTKKIGANRIRQPQKAGKEEAGMPEKIIP
jgi:hypothetical protein